MPYNDLNEEFLDGAWADMKARLDQEMPQRLPVGLWWRTGFAFVLLAAFGIWAASQLLLDTNEPVALSHWPIPIQGNKSSSPDKFEEGQVEPERLAVFEKNQVQSPKHGHNLGSQGISSNASVPKLTEPQERSLTVLSATPQLVEAPRGKALAIIPVPRLTRSSQKAIPMLPGLDQVEFDPEPREAKFTQLPPQIPGPWYGSLSAGGLTVFRTAIDGAWSSALAHYRLHPKWELWGGVDYAYSRTRRVESRALRNYKAEVLHSGAPPVLDTSGPEASWANLDTAYFASGGRLEEPAVHRIGIPIGIGYRLGKAWYIRLGFQMNALITAKGGAGAQEDALVMNPGNRASEEIMGKYRHWEPSIHGGLEWRMAPAWSLKLQYQQGLVDIDLTEAGDATQSSLRAGLSWQFGR